MNPKKSTKSYVANQIADKKPAPKNTLFSSPEMAAEKNAKLRKGIERIEAEQDKVKQATRAAPRSDRS